MSFNTTISTQDTVIRRLESKGFRVTRITRFEGDDAPMAFMSRRRRCSLHLCQVDPDASVHGYFEWSAPTAARSDSPVFKKLGLDEEMIAKYLPIVMVYVKSKGGDMLKGYMGNLFD